MLHQYLTSLIICTGLATKYYLKNSTRAALMTSNLKFTQGLSAGLQAQARSGILLHLIKLEKEKKVSKQHGQYFVPTACPF